MNLYNFQELSTKHVLIALSTCAVSTYVLYRLFKWKKVIDLKKSWNEVGKDVVVLHQFKRGKYCPNLGPFALKVETYLRLAKINYIVDTKIPFGAKGKCPWITLNGEEIPDSQFIIESLQKRFNVQIDSHLSEKELCSLEALRILVDEHLLWPLALWRYSIDKSGTFLKTQDLGFYFNFFMRTVMPIGMKKRAVVQGIGRHSDEEVYEIAKKDCYILSTMLGDKQYFGGNSPSTSDCAIFGMLAQLMWNSPGSEYELILKSCYKNLEAYCERMRRKVFPDWDSLLISQF